MSEQKIKITAAVVTALLFISLIFVGVTMKNNTGLKKEVDTEKLKTENVLAEKLKLDKQIVDFRKDLASLTGQNSELNGLVTELQVKLDEKEESIKRLGNENGSLRRFRREAEDLRKMRDQLQAQIVELNSNSNKLEADILELNQTIASLQQQNQGLNHRISEMLANNAANFKVEVVRRNPERLTHKAKRTHTILVTFDMPKKDGRRNFRFDLQSPTGTNLPGDLKVEAVSLGTLSASIDANSAALDTERVTLAFTPESRLSQGTYAIFIFEGNNYINNLQFRLSK
jgi:predicted  nucleic acid-binding Zn-ribbon protein